ncbi:lysosome membrane protein 2-like isoform X3 [Phymastichus coffea]|uniref:lysosome membrane protein 2-like isoform X3 n=1 Tax=Phymastichus coffea TaxID=108790 RepID=UPI00273AF7A5|nr:lysosome membrane protein 2-like isoform X3 [Phymastichus coffea]
MEKAVERNLKIGISRNRPGFWLLSSLVVLSLSLCAVSWLTEVFSDAIVSRLQLRNGSLSFAWWQHPTVRAVYRIHVFNYTNVEDFEAGRAAKLHVHEIGPYVYRETVARIKPKIADNLHEISYQEMRSYQWEGGSPDDEQLTVPNVPLFTAIAFARDMSFIAQLSLTAVLSTIRSKPFLKLPVHSYLWGYDDELFRLAKPLISWQQNIPYDNFGILAFKAGVSKDRLTISSGLDDIRNLGNTIYFNGRSNRNIWHDQKCDKVEGSDGSMFPPSLIRDHTYNIKFYAKEMCRSIPLQYYGKSYAKGIPSLRLICLKRLAVPIGGWSRVQINMEVRKADAVPFLGRLKDGAILPVLWIEVGIDEIPDSVMNILYHSYYTANTIEACLQWGSLLSLFSSVFLFTYMHFKNRYINQPNLLF